MADTKNYYKILGVSESAKEDEIKSAYRKLAKRYHPDSHPGDAECEKKFREISEAYSILSDFEKKKKYDAGNKTKKAESSSFKRTKGEFQGTKSADVDFENIYKSFEQFFGFDPNTRNVINEEKLKPKSVNPLDTTKMFERFMKIK